MYYIFTMYLYTKLSFYTDLNVPIHCEIKYYTVLVNSHCELTNIAKYPPLFNEVFILKSTS